MEAGVSLEDQTPDTAGGDVPHLSAQDRARITTTALGLFRIRGWALALLGVIGLSLIFALLGRWQWGRYQSRVARNAVISANYHRASMPLNRVLSSPGRPLPVSRQWTPVTLTGHYLTERTVLIRHRPVNTVYGYEVVVPLLQGDGSVILVDRGWIPNGRTAAEPSTRPYAILSWR